MLNDSQTTYKDGMGDVDDVIVFSATNSDPIRTWLGLTNRVIPDISRIAAGSTKSD